MNNILLVTSREYFSRVKKRSFIIMTLLAPILITAFYGGIGYVAMNENVGSKEKTFAVVDESQLFTGKLVDSEKVKFEMKDEILATSLHAEDNTYTGIIRVPKDYSIDKELHLSYTTNSSLSVTENEKIEDAFRAAIKQEKLSSLGVTQNDIDKLRTKVTIDAKKVGKDGKEVLTSIGANTIVGMVAALLIYFFIFIYGVQVMKGVIEEKTNRIVEIIVSTVKPFQLMLGKVLGIALVGLTQLSMWIVLTGILMGVSSLVLGYSILDADQMTTVANNPAMQNGDPDLQQMFGAIASLPITTILVSFVFYFLGGYLFYGALFAAIGSAVDSETDTQQFMLPITLPLVFSMVISFSVVINDPNGVLATWLSMIPFSSPIVMMARIPFGVEPTELILSIVILLASILGVIWLAGKIYRTGILMYGKKPTYKEIGKWLFYKN